MTRTQFRILVVVSFVLSLVGGVVDLIVPDPIVEEVTSYAESLEPEWSDARLFALMGFLLLGIVYVIYTLLGLLLFWNMARHVYLAGFFFLIPMYLVLGVTVTSGIGQILYDAGSVLSGVILALIYFSPVKDFFTKPPSAPF